MKNIHQCSMTLKGPFSEKRFGLMLTRKNSVRKAVLLWVKYGREFSKNWFGLMFTIEKNGR